ncbi:mevalonate kinase [Legionella massiliensis]|uniref:Mevalonate kinase n=1 Tax=Legionella massiliensis TaxID=1034943 RepID=A0A078KXZ5_9GAMM|nr:mevalonate kinase [Legionella massiliensis]CDZ77831.1 mevalonate kinase [Legionella massiliensis]CEE13569.1 mevalonate kinase [Legionella massiliensis]
MSYDFQTTTHGKWILAGEHAVLRGHGALVFPIKEKKLTLSYRKSGNELSADYVGTSGTDMHLLFWSVLEQGQQLLGRSLNNLDGHFHIYSDIPIGVGMGASAALCVATARWFAAQNFLAEDAIFSFAKDLENLFHGKSSGLDIAGVAAESGILFQQGNMKPVHQSWQPHWFLSSCGQIGITSHCINQVNEIWQNDPAKAAFIDQKMSDSVKMSADALEKNTAESLNNLAKAINLTADCFKQWGLISETLQQHMQMLLNSGALAVKPTGSGGGGYVLSLWQQPPEALPTELIAV